MINYKVEKQIIKNVDLIMLLDELGVDYKDWGRDVRTVCVFHKDASKPNLSLNKDKKIMQCFSHHCEQHGYNLIDFVMRVGKFSERDNAIEFMAKLSGVEIDSKGWNIRSVGFYKNNALIFKESAINYYKSITNMESRGNKLYLKKSDMREYHLKLIKTKSAINYLESRRLNCDDIEDFYLGYDWEEKQIIIPVYDENGDLKSVGKRIIYETDENKYKPKYKYIGNKAECLYGYYNLIEKGMEINNIILVEGVFDAIILQQYGYNAVGLLGCLISDYQLKLLKEMAPDHITICLDNDSVKSKNDAGMEGTLKCINKLSKAGFNLDKISVIRLNGNYQDPDQVPEIEFRRFYERKFKALDYYLMNQIR